MNFNTSTEVNDILYHWPYWQASVLIFLYFILLYFLFAFLFEKGITLLAKKKWISKIDHRPLMEDQEKKEKRNSVLSMLIFGLHTIPVLWVIRMNWTTVWEDTPLLILASLVIVFLWNEIHFFMVHRLLHIPYFMKTVHKVHHRSRTPTIYSIFSFHWFEAFLLGTVSLTYILIFPFSPLVLGIFPIVSIVLNFIGHCNYRFGNGTGRSWKLFATHHNEHHGKGRQNFGFAINWLDKLNVWIKQW
jgi:sterol desaturase/sphingolipid hydroxylase (fatty acid hydroxylase superfamily)